jgi:hypothetical protein
MLMKACPNVARILTPHDPTTKPGRLLDGDAIADTCPMRWDDQGTLLPPDYTKGPQGDDEPA